MAAKKAAISILMTADAAKAKAAFADVEKRAGSLQNQMGNVAKAIGGAFATQKIIGFAKSAINATSDLAESANAVQVTFGKASKGIFEFGENAAQAVGMSKTEFNAFAVQFAGFTKQLAGANGDVVQVTTELTTRIADFASVMNLDIPRAAQIFQSSLAGSTEPIRAFGIDLSAAAVAAYAVENGIAESAATMTEAEKVTARYGLLMESTAQTAGDFANTSDSLANSQRILKANFENVRAEMGEALVPVMTEVLNVAKPVLDAFTALPDGVKKVVVIAGLAGATFKSVSTSLQGMGVAAGTANRALGAVGLVLTAAVSIYSIYNRGKQQAIANTNAFVDALKAEAGGQENATDTHIANLLSVEKLQATYQALGLTTADVAEIIRGETNPTFDAAAQLLEDVRRGTTDLANANAVLSDEYGVTYSELKNFVAEVNNQEKALADAEAQVALNVKTQTELGVITEDNTQATEELNQALEDQERELQAVVTATLSAFNAQLGYESQTWATDDAVANYTDTLGSLLDGTYEGTDAARDLAKAENEVYEAALRQAAAAAQLAADTAKASGEQLTAAETAKIQQDELQKIADTLDPGNPLRTQLQGYITALNSIPKTITTTLKIREVIQKARETAGTQSGMGSGRSTTTTIPGRAMGGFVAGNTPYVVGENGPELFIPSSSGRINPNAGGTIVINVAGTVIAERDLIEAVRRGLVDSQRSGRQLVY
jgi:hypothetical protein